MSNSFIQPSFASGEIAPSLYARVDLAKYHVAAKLLRNMFVHAHGGVSNRPGTQFVGRVLSGGNDATLIPFQFSTTQTYILLFGDYYMRVVMNGGYVLEPTVPITGVTKANPGVVTANAHGYANGDWIFIAGVNGMVDLNSTPGKIYRVANSTANTFTLTDLDLNPISTASYTAYISGGTAARIYTLTTPYAGADVKNLKWAQSADTLTLCHTDYIPRDLTRTQHWAWTLTPITFAPTISAPASPSASNSSGVGTWNYQYVVTAVADSPPSESRASAIADLPTVVQLNQSTGVSNLISWTAVAGASRYRIYKANPLNNLAIPSGALFGYIGNTAGTSFYDTNYSPDFTQCPPQAANPFSGGSDSSACNVNPSVVTYFQQRKVFAASRAQPQTIWMSQPGDYKNMDTSNPSRASDAITLTIAANQVNVIKHFVSTKALLVMTNGGAWKLDAGSGANAITPSQVSVLPQSYTGSSDVQPIVINYDILYVQTKGSIVRDLAYNFYADLFTGSDMSVLSNHLFFGHQIIRWAFAEEPFKLIWAVREDGEMLLFTYLKEQDVYAWTHADTPGHSRTDIFLSVASIPETINGNNEDSVYVITQRSIPGVRGGTPIKYVERVASRNFLTDGVADVTKGWFVDSGLQYSGSPTSVITGLDYLNGAYVSILADGNVHPRQVVSNGTITLQHTASNVIVGLPYQSQMQTLCLEPDEIQAKVQSFRKKISAVMLRVTNSRGLKVGPAWDTLITMKERTQDIAFGQPIPLFTGDQRIIIDNRYEIDDTVCIQQDNPLPCTILGVIPDVSVGQ